MEMEYRMLFVGVDPGQSGSVAIVSEFGFVGVLRNTEPIHALGDWLRTVTNGQMARAVIEQVGVMPKQGIVSAFKFGRSYGQLEGVLAAVGIPYEFARPQKWQKAMGCLTGGDKNVSKAKAFQLFPNHKWTHAEADAVLIAEYCRRSS